MNYDFDYFSGSDIQYPKKPVKPTIGRNPTAIEARAFANSLEDYERDLESYKESAKYYEFQRNERHLLFVEEMQKEFNDISSAQFDVIWSEAYDKGHSGGLPEIYNYFSSLYDFIKEYESAKND